MTSPTPKAPDPAPAYARRPGWRLTTLGGLGVALATLALLVATEPRLAIVWDEGFTLGREARVRLWLQALRDPAGFAAGWVPPTSEMVQPDRPGRQVPAPSASEVATRAGLLRPRVVAWFWPFGREEPHGHPPFYAIEGLLGDLLAPTWDVLPRARLGPILAFSLTAGALFAAVGRRWGLGAGALAAGAWVGQPHLFGHAHYATLDALLSGLWVGATLAFARAVERPGRWPAWGAVLVFGVLVGWAADTKLTGWFLPLPLAVWTALARDRRGLWTLLVGAPVAALTVYLFNPPWWSDPLGGLARFLESNLSRGETIPIPVQFFGRVYLTPRESLPAYNTLAWTVLATPLGFLGLALAGVVRSLRRFRSDPLGGLAVCGWAFLLALRALPGTPGHDGTRQILAAFGMLALVAGAGAAWAIERWGWAGQAWVAAALAEAAVSVGVMMPVPLSYYSPLVGGLPGATALGMEPTYFWDGLTSDALEWLNDQTRPGEKVAFATNPTSWLYLRQSGRLRPDYHPAAPGRYAWYVLQNRPGAFRPVDRALAASGRPAYVVRKLGVPLVWIYPFAEFEAMQGATGGRGAGPR